MAKLLYRTRGDTTPQGKPRVYFACHGEDFKGYFETIANEILQISNCAIYYYEEEPAPDEDYYLNLGQMQLIVMPVTSRMLYQPCRAMDVEFPYAVTHHIPVLPLMQEQDLEQRFNEKCGDLQFLDKYDADPTALPYGDKLKKYLEAVLVGDELAAKVRAAFDAYIFLSYRKKDRKFAQELMRLIHRNPACRDIAIWYDEFLTPGENWGDAIRSALEKSGLFVLAVTPNLVNEINYVMTTEYPMAKKAGMPILPAEMEPTDPDALRENYDGIPDCVDPREEGVLTDAVLGSLRSLALLENDNDPQHNFFIGLAYLSGIDVEVDHAYAVKLITAAAEAGITEAMEKLVSMYESGEGVKRDYLTAILWREKLVKQAKAQYETTGSEEDGYDYIILLWDLGDAWNSQRNLSRARSVYEEMLAVSQRTATEYGGRRGYRYLSVSYNKLGNIARAEEDLAGAKKWYRKCLEIDERLSESGTPGSLRDLSISYINLGDIAQAEGDLAGAKEWYRRSLEVRERLSESGTLESLRGLSISYERLGGIAKAENDLAGAKKWYRKCLEVRKRLSESGTPGSLRDLIISYIKLGDIVQAEGDFAGAKEWYRKCLEIAEKLSESGTPESLRDLSVIYERLGDIAKAQGDLTGAKQWHRKGLAVRERLSESGTPESLRDLSVSYNKLGDIAKVEGDPAAAKEWYRKGLEIAEKLSESGTPGSLRDLSVSYNRLGEISIVEGDLAGAKEWYRKGLEIEERLSESETPESQRDLSISYDRLGDIAQAEGDLAAAKEWYRKCLKASKKRTEAAETVENYDDLAISCYKVGITTADARMLREALAIFRFLAEQCPQIPSFSQKAEIVEEAIQSLQNT